MCSRSSFYLVPPPSPHLQKLKGSMGTSDKENSKSPDGEIKLTFITSLTQKMQEQEEREKSWEWNKED